jgi:integron integrase
MLSRIFGGMSRSTHQGPGLELVRPPAKPCGLSPAPAPVTPPAFDVGAFLERLRQRIRARGLSDRTEEAYLYWARRYLDFHGRRNPASLGRVDLDRFVTYLATEAGLAAQTQNQAASAVVFVYKELVGQDFGGRNGLVRPKEPKVLPKYATPDEVARILDQLRGVPLVAAMLMYGSGTRIAETLSIRLKDLALGTRELHVRGGKGGKDRTTVIAETALPLLREQIEKAERQHAHDLEQGGGWAELPGAMHRKDPRAGWDLGWQYLFPASITTVDQKTGRVGRRHLHESVIQRALKQAVRAAKVTRPVSSHVLRHCFATELLRSGTDIRLLQRLMGHKDLKTTALYLHILERPGIGLVSPLDRLRREAPTTPHDANPQPGPFAPNGGQTANSEPPPQPNAESGNG